MFELKRLSPEGVKTALQKAEQYRRLNEPWQAESICRDVLEVEPGNQQALVALLLSLTDRFKERSRPAVEDVKSLLPQLEDSYHRAYYAGIISERKGTAVLNRDVLGTGSIVYRWLTEAMQHYEEAQDISPAGNQDAIVRWNTCARLIMLNRHVRPARDSRQEPPLE